MLTSQKDIVEVATGTFKNPFSPSLKFPDGPHSMYLYVKGDNGKRVDVLLNHQDVIRFIYIHENIVSKAFVVKLNTDFGTNVRTMTTVSGNCFDFTPFKVSDKMLFSDVLVFEHTRSNDLFPLIQVDPYLSQSANLAGKDLYPNFRGTSKRLDQPRG